jgi:hypothetical protein
MNPPLPPSPASEADIARRARVIWASRGCPEGCDVEIWLEAERELRAAAAAPAKPARRAHTSTTITAKSPKTASGDEKVVDDKALDERLRTFGEPPRRSPTSVDLT